MKPFEIRADYDEKTIVVYQAYSPAIALPALQEQKFVAPFSMNRMTWIKPSFLWMAERCGWARKPGQEMVLAVRITREGWEEALSNAVLTTPSKRVYRDAAEWEALLKQSPVRVQWDPERNIHGQSLDARSIQVGLSRHIVDRYVNHWIVEISDYTPLMKKIYALLHEGQRTKATGFLPRERVYDVPEEIAKRLGTE